MKTKTRIFFLVVFLAAGAAGLWFYDWVLGETQEASGPIAAIALDSEQTAVARTYEIMQDASEARYVIFEELRGQPVDVIGTTNQVAGQFILSLDDLGAAQMGVIQINARTFTTDEERRDRATRNRILSTDEHEFITFTPTEITGLSGSADRGDTVSFSVSGDLTIRNVVHPAVFEATMKIASVDLLVGEATTTVSRSDYNLTIPDLPFLANVADEVRLSFAGQFRAVETTP